MQIYLLTIVATVCRQCSQHSMPYNPIHPNEEEEATKCVWSRYLLVGPNGMHFFKKSLLQEFGLLAPALR
jgi:hypothetical protein